MKPRRYLGPSVNWQTTGLQNPDWRFESSRPCKLASDDILQLMKKEGKFSVFTHWISNLGETNTKTYFAFNLVVISYCAFNLYFVYRVQELFSTSFQSILSFLFFGAYSFFLILILLFPQDKNFKVHRQLSIFLFLSIFSGIILLFLPLKTFGILYPSINIILTATIFTGILMGLSSIKMYLKYGTVPRILTDIRKNESSVLIKNACFLEWIFFTLLISFQLTLVIF